MFIYWLLFSIFLLLVFFNYKSHFFGSKYLSSYNNISWNFTLLILTTFIGFRFEVGGDWFHYLKLIESVKDKPFFNSFGVTDPLYDLINWLASQLNLGPFFINFLCAYFFSMGLIKFCKSQPQPWLVLYISLPYLIIVVAMGYTRQSVAIGFTMLSLVALQNGKVLHFIFWIILAALFHKTAIIMIPLALFSSYKSWKALFGVLITAFLMYFLLLSEYLDSLISGYIFDQYDSSGALIRILMNVLPAIIFLIYRKRFILDDKQKSFWIWFSYSALFLAILLPFSPSSTVIDRLSLYWIPLQLFVFSRLPQAMSFKYETQLQWLILILIYYFCVIYTWLFYADHREKWIPYKFYLFEFLWN